MELMASESSALEDLSMQQESIQTQAWPSRRSRQIRPETPDNRGKGPYLPIAGRGWGEQKESPAEVDETPLNPLITRIQVERSNDTGPCGTGRVSRYRLQTDPGTISSGRPFPPAATGAKPWRALPA